MANKKITELMAGTPTRDSLIESATDVGGTTVSRKFEVGAVADLNNIQIANEFDNTSTYNYGDYCIREGVLYRNIVPITVAEAWTSAHWTAVMVTGEYKRVRIMTKAQFDLLSNDEKDGFIYVSDYPTKIQDIDNVTLTTSDNNKLLGVSVSGSDISVGAVSIPIITVKDYRVTLGTTLWNGVYWGEQNITSDVSIYGNPISAVISELLDTGSTRINRPTFAQLMTMGADQFIVRAYSPQASSAAGFDAIIRVVYSNVSILT